MTLLGPSEVRQLAQELELHPRKSLGQNFVVDPNTIRRIVRLAGLPPGSHVLEVGPGLGSLTLGLLEAGHRVTAVEIDPRLAGRLPATVGQQAPDAAARLDVVVADAATVGEDPSHDLGSPQAMVANLPYNVAVPVLLHCLAEFPSLERTLVMVQSEVADRLVAGPGGRVYGVPSVKVRWFGDAHRVGSVPSTVFWPMPRVDSGLVLITGTSAPKTPVRRVDVFALVDELFGRRRKMLRTTLSDWLGKGAAVSVLAAAGVPGDLRPERLALSDFIAIAEAIAAAGDGSMGAGGQAMSDVAD